MNKPVRFEKRKRCCQRNFWSIVPLKCGHHKDSLRQRRQGFGKHEGPRKGREGRARATPAVLEKNCSSRKSLLPQSLRNLSKPIRSKEKAMPFSPAIEACRVPDERLAGAYEETSAAHRSWIKTTLALAEATYPACGRNRTRPRRFRRLWSGGRAGPDTLPRPTRVLS